MDPGFQTGADFYFEKPVSLDRLRSTLADIREVASGPLPAE